MNVNDTTEALTNRSLLKRGLQLGGVASLHPHDVF